MITTLNQDGSFIIRGKFFDSFSLAGDNLPNNTLLVKNAAMLEITSDYVLCQPTHLSSGILPEIYLRETDSNYIRVCYDTMHSSPEACCGTVC